MYYQKWPAGFLDSFYDFVVLLGFQMLNKMGKTRSQAVSKNATWKILHCKLMAFVYCNHHLLHFLNVSNQCQLIMETISDFQVWAVVITQHCNYSR